MTKKKDKSTLPTDHKWTKEEIRTSFETFINFYSPGDEFIIACWSKGKNQRYRTGSISQESVISLLDK